MTIPLHIQPLRDLFLEVKECRRRTIYLLFDISPNTDQGQGAQAIIDRISGDGFGIIAQLERMSRNRSSRMEQSVLRYLEEIYTYYNFEENSAQEFKIQELYQSDKRSGRKLHQKLNDFCFLQKILEIQERVSRVNQALLIVERSEKGHAKELSQEIIREASRLFSYKCPIRSQSGDRYYSKQEEHCSNS